MALALNRVAVLELLLNHDVNIKSFLKTTLLEFSYGYASRSNFSPMKKMIDEDKDYDSFKGDDKHYKTVTKLCSYNGQEVEKCSIDLSKIEVIVKRLCRSMIKAGHEDFTEVMLKDFCRLGKLSSPQILFRQISLVVVVSFLLGWLLL